MEIETYIRSSWSGDYLNNGDFFLPPLQTRRRRKVLTAVIAIIGIHSDMNWEETSCCESECEEKETKVREFLILICSRSKDRNQFLFLNSSSDWIRIQCQPDPRSGFIPSPMSQPVHWPFQVLDNVAPCLTAEDADCRREKVNWNPGLNLIMNLKKIGSIDWLQLTMWHHAKETELWKVCVERRGLNV